MRPIKFRGKLVDDNDKWAYGSLHMGDSCWILRKSLNEGKGLAPFRPMQVIPETVGQYTGLLGKNGVEIYEGDICREVHNAKEFIGQIAISPTQGTIIGNRESWFKLWIPDVEVLGNIYDNPEFLQEAAKCAR